MLENRQQDAKAFLDGVLAYDWASGSSSQESPGALESLIAPAPEALQPQVVPEGAEALVERTIGKISEGRTLDVDETFALEAIIIPDKRPAIDVMAHNAFSTDHALWQHLNSGPAHDAIVRAIPSVGRIELPGHPSLPYGGTGFVVGLNLLMTNRHVAEIFARGLGDGVIDFLPGGAAAIDFERRADGGSLPLEVRHVVMIHPYWDMALLAVDGLPAGVAPLRLAVAIPDEPLPDVVAIGYPAFDPRNDAGVQNQVFRGVYNVKRLMPGKLTGRAQTFSFDKTLDASTHDSSTLGGASGSAILLPKTGAIVALHFGGQYLKTNFGVPAADLARDPRVIDAGVQFDAVPRPSAGPWDAFWKSTEGLAGRSAPRTAAAAIPPAPAASPTLATVTLPLTVTISVAVGAPDAPPALASSAPAPEEVAVTEAPVESYRDRRGYQPAFLGFDVPLPIVRAAADDVLRFSDEGRTETELRYQHFSVVMSRSRRLCFFSAVNIDGGQPRKMPRTGWRTDPRIPADQQILNDCYGPPPRFSRGHMTRREDPIWGDRDTAAQGNADAMHVTNTVPQMQAFNSPIWLALEDHALQHSREDAMSISVFTGPYFTARDPVRDGVRIPTSFWKVIAFIHDRTGQLCATGYQMDQSASLVPVASTEFVFGQFRSPQLGMTTQTTLRAIERRSGLSFGDLANADPRSRATEALGEDEDVALMDMEQITFLS